MSKEYIKFSPSYQYNQDKQYDIHAIDRKSTSENYTAQNLLNQSSSESDISDSEYSSYLFKNFEQKRYSPEMVPYKQLDGHLQNIEEIIKNESIQSNQFEEKKKQKTYTQLKQFTKLVEGDGSLFQLFNQCCGSTSSITDSYKNHKYIKVISKILKLLNILVKSMLNTKIQLSPSVRMLEAESRLFGSISAHSKINESNLRQSQISFKAASQTSFLNYPTLSNQFMKSSQRVPASMNQRVETPVLISNKAQDMKIQAARISTLGHPLIDKGNKAAPINFEKKKKKVDILPKKSFNLLLKK